MRKTPIDLCSGWRWIRESGKGKRGSRVTNEEEWLLRTAMDLPHKHRCSQVFCQLWTFQMEERLSEAFSLGQFSLRIFWYPVHLPADCTHCLMDVCIQDEMPPVLLVASDCGKLEGQVLMINRRQFGPKGKEEVRIIEHQMQALRLMSHLATTLALTFTSRHAAFVLDENIFQGRELSSSRSLQALVAGLKAYSTWETISCLQDCRECSGGMSHGENTGTDSKKEEWQLLTLEYTCTRSSKVARAVARYGLPEGPDKLEGRFPLEARGGGCPSR
ncbi:hypothetical protein ACRRTK_013735 [Alexandromys fortis]